MKTEETQKFDVSLRELEKIVEKLEEGDLSLEESLKLFEDGVKLSRQCREKLDRAEKANRGFTKRRRWKINPTLN